MLKLFCPEATNHIHNQSLSLSLLISNRLTSSLSSLSPLYCRRPFSEKNNRRSRCTSPIARLSSGITTTKCVCTLAAKAGDCGRLGRRLNSNLGLLGYSFRSPDNASADDHRRPPPPTVFASFVLCHSSFTALKRGLDVVCRRTHRRFPLLLIDTAADSLRHKGTLLLLLLPFPTDFVI